MSVCGTGATSYTQSFSRLLLSMLPYSIFGPLRPGLPTPGSCPSKVSLCLNLWRLRNLHRMCIDYAFRPRLRSRLTQGGRTFPWNPWSIGVWDSHPHLATHANILTSMQSTCPYGHASSRIESSPTHHNDAVASVVSFSPGNFRRRITRPVSYYALFK